MAQIYADWRKKGRGSRFPERPEGRTPNMERILRFGLAQSRLWAMLGP